MWESPYLRAYMRRVSTQEAADAGAKQIAVAVASTRRSMFALASES
jgi:hypothetical protein